MIPLRDYRPSRGFPIITVLLIAANVLVYLYETALSTQIDLTCSRLAHQFVSQSDCFFYQYGLVPHWLVSSPSAPSPVAPLPLWATLFSSMFVHAGFLHLAGNMWFLWIFGDNVEDALGSIGFLLFYFLTGLVAAASQVLSSPDSIAPMIGASGAIAGVLGAYLVLYPWGRVRTLVLLVIFIQIVDLPALLFLGLWFLLQILVPQGGVATMAHLGGFIAGALFALVFRRHLLPPEPSGP
jgi:membrane associated rhomboid family serine protease